MNSRSEYQTTSLYQRIGGEAALRSFVSRFYSYMDSLPEVRPVRDLYTMSLDEAGERLFQFLSGWLGGPPLFHQSYGEPRLRRRHMHIPIDDAERYLWLMCAHRALDEMDWPIRERDELMQGLSEMTIHLRNQGALNSGCNAHGGKCAV